MRAHESVVLILEDRCWLAPVFGELAPIYLIGKFSYKGRPSRKSPHCTTRCVRPLRQMQTRPSQANMPRSLQFGLLLIAPVAVFAMMIAADRFFAPTGLGREYVVHIDLPP